MTKKKNFEILRKCWHTFSGLLVAGIYRSGYLSKSHFLTGLSLLLCVSLIVEYLRTTDDRINKRIIQLMKPVMRRRELTEVSGVPYYLFGCLVVSLLFSQTIAILSILYLAIGDSFASFCGRKWGNLSFKFKNGKSLIGLGGAILSSSIVGYFYLATYCHFTPKNTILISCLGGIIGGVAESISFLDDNLFVPIFSGICLSFVFYFF
jgi:diacylglycerol kinase (CTP)